MEAIPKFDIKSVIKSDISTKLTTWIGHKGGGGMEHRPLNPHLTKTLSTNCPSWPPLEKNMHKAGTIKHLASV